MADALSVRRTRLPRLSVVSRYVRACGGAPSDIACWEDAWRACQVWPSVTPTREASAPARPHQLPGAVSHFRGRAKQTEQLDSLHHQPGNRRPGGPLALIVGPAGVGKTALALQWGHQVAREFPDGQLFIDLVGCGHTPPVTTREALRLVLRALGAASRDVPRELSAQVGLYRSLVYSRRLLIVLDNARDAEQVRPLLPGGPRCFTVITGRNTFPGLVAREDGLQMTLRCLLEDDARTLLAKMLGEGRTSQEPEATDELARLCGYLPLALRIAAANLVERPRHPLKKYVAELAGGCRIDHLVVAGDGSTAVRAALDASYATFDLPTRELVRGLAAAPEPEFTIREVASLLRLTLAQARARLDALVAAHIVEATDQGTYVMHDLVRCYAQALCREGTPV